MISALPGSRQTYGVVVSSWRIADRFTSWLTWLKVLREESMEAMPKISYRKRLDAARPLLSATLYRKRRASIGRFHGEKPNNDEKPKLKRKQYEKEMRRLQAELCKLQEWVKFKGLRIMIVFEGRDGAGKGEPSKRLQSA